MTTQPGRFTRTGIRRSGDDYQDLCALEIIVEMLEHPTRYQWIQVEADDAGALDDILALQKDQRLVARQIKYSGHPDEDSDAWTWDKFLTETDGSGKQKTSLLDKWFRSWQQLNRRGTVASASVESNRKAGHDLINIIDPAGLIPVERIPADIWAEISRQFGDEGQAKAFFSDFKFYLDRPELDVLEDGLTRRFYQRGGTPEGWLSLKDELRFWVRERSQPQPSGLINVSVVRAAAGWNVLTVLPEDLEIPSDYVLPSQSFHDSFLASVVQGTQGCQVLAAFPALGKSTYLSYLVGQLREAHVPVIRHHYFLSLDDRTPRRLDHRRIAESLMSELQASYPDSLGELGYENPVPEDLGSWIEAAGSYFSNEGKKLVVVIDGLDHVWRQKKSSEELDSLFEHLLPSPSGVVIVLGTQPVDDDQLPNRLLRECPREEWTQLEPLDQDAVAAWLENHLDELDLPSDANFKQRELRHLASAFFTKTEGHPLHLLFVLGSLLERGQGVSTYEIEQLPGTPGKDIRAYYSALWESLPDNGRQILHLLACTNFIWPTSGLIEALDPDGKDLPSVHIALRQVGHLLARTTLGRQPFHGSLSIFVRSQESYPEYAERMRTKARRWLAESAPEYWRWAYSWFLDAEDGQPAALIDGPSREWMIESLSLGYPRNQISEILGRSAWAALETGQLARFVELALLRDYLEWNEYPSLLRIQLALGRNDRLNDISLFNKDRTELLDIVSLANHEFRDGNLTAVDECLDAISRKNPIESNSDQTVEWARCLMMVASLLPDVELDRIINFLSQFRNSGRSVEILDAFACNMRLAHNMSGLRKLLAAFTLTMEEHAVVRQHAVNLAFEDTLDIGLQGFQIWDDPFSCVYRCLRLQDIGSSPSASFPQFSLLDPPNDFSYTNRPITRFFKLAFYALLSKHLRNETNLIDEWIEQAPTPDAGDLLRRLNYLAASVAGASASQSAIPFVEPYRHFEDAKFPNRWNDRDAYRLGNGMQVALNEISFDLVYLQREWTAPGTVKDTDFKEALSSPFLERWNWVSSYIQYAKPFLPDSTVDWLLTDSERSVKLDIESFPTQAERFGELATFSLIHNREQDETIRLLRKAVSSTISYRYHKDMLISSMLDIAEACHKSGIDGAENWILSLAPAIAQIDDFTDGDETRYFPQQLGQALAFISPSLLPDYYIWLTEQEEYFDAQTVFHEYLKRADLTDPISRAIARTGVDHGSLLALQKRSKEGDPQADDLLGLVVAQFGTSPDEDSEVAGSNHSDQEGLAKDEEPRAMDFSPPQIKEFLAACNAKLPYQSSRFIEAWIKYWDDNQNGLQAFEAVKELADSGYDVRNGDLIAEMARKFDGEEEAYLWITAANREEFGWEQFISRKETVLTRWEQIRDHYPDRWLRFIQETVTRELEEPWSRMTMHGNVLRLVEYCIALGKQDHAFAIAETVLATIHELTSPIDLRPSDWLELKREEEGK